MKTFETSLRCQQSAAVHSTECSYCSREEILQAQLQTSNQPQLLPMGGNPALNKTLP